VASARKLNTELRVMKKYLRSDWYLTKKYNEVDARKKRRLSYIASPEATNHAGDRSKRIGTRLAKLLLEILLKIPRIERMPKLTNKI
jgi:hypothetical protein